MIIKNEILFESTSLSDNPLHDPHKRKIVLLEPKQKEGRPILIFLSGYGSSSLSMLNYDPFGGDMETRIKTLLKKRKIKDSIFVFPDMFTKVGGNQYINSSAVGKYEDFLIKELIPYLKEKYSSDRVALLGGSSGGYGGIMLAMKHRGVVDAVVDHSGDIYFEYCYLPAFPKACVEIAKYSSAEKWLSAYWKKENKYAPADRNALNVVGMAAFYSPSGTKIELPFSLDNCEIDEKVWKRWLENDPVRAVDKYYKNLKSLKFLMIDVGTHDEYNHNFGNRILHKKLLHYRVRHLYEEFEGGHNAPYRYNRSIPLVENVLNKI